MTHLCEVRYQTTRSANEKYGRIQALISDNGQPFALEEVRIWFDENIIEERKWAPWNPQENGMAERQMRKIVKAIRCGEVEVTPMNESVRIFVLANNSWPHSATMLPPNYLFLNQPVRIPF